MTTVSQLNEQFRANGFAPIGNKNGNIVRASVGVSYVTEKFVEAIYNHVVGSLSPGEYEPWFTLDGLKSYIYDLFRVRVHYVSDERGLISTQAYKQLKVPLFIYACLEQMGEVNYEKYGVRLRVSYFTESEESEGMTLIGAEGVMSLHDRGDALLSFSESFEALSQRIGLRLSDGMPQGREGNADFMMFVWSEYVIAQRDNVTSSDTDRLMHMHTDVEPGIQGLASFMRIERDLKVLSPSVYYSDKYTYSEVMRDTVKR